jgi:hypothetical protein
VTSVHAFLYCKLALKQEIVNLQEKVTKFNHTVTSDILKCVINDFILPAIICHQTLIYVLLYNKIRN